MSRKSIAPKDRHHVFFYRGDWEYISDRFGDGAPPDMRLGTGATIAEIVHAKVLELKAKERLRIEQSMRQPITEAEASFAEANFAEANLAEANLEEPVDG